jgi:hypothetical protein
VTLCACGCGLPTKGGKWRPGHNARRGSLLIPPALTSASTRKTEAFLERCLRLDPSLPPLLLIAIPFEGSPCVRASIRAHEMPRFLAWARSSPVVWEFVMAASDAWEAARS